jgi:hypothetical protein
LPEALEPLKACWPQCHSLELRQQVLLSIAILRRPGANDHLMELIASEDEPTAIAALWTLRIFKDDPRLRAQIAELVRNRRSPKLLAVFDRDFGPWEPSA